VQGVRMVRLVHRNRFGIVVDGDVDRAAKRGFDACAGAAAAGEDVDDQSVH